VTDADASRTEQNGNPRALRHELGPKVSKESCTNALRAMPDARVTSVNLAVILASTGAPATAAAVRHARLRIPPPLLLTCELLRLAGDVRLPTGGYEHNVQLESSSVH
jgi:hypothetical protein